MDDERPLDWADEEDEDDFRDFGANEMGRLTDLVASIQPPKRKTFFDRLTPDDQAELLELCRDFREGKLKSATTEALGKKLGPVLGVSPCTISRWFREQTNGQIDAGSGAVAKPEGSQRRKGKAKAPRGAS